MKRATRPTNPPAVPIGIVLDRRLRPRSLRLVAALLRGTGGSASCLTGDEDLAALCDAGPRTIERGFRELESLGYVRREGLPWAIEGGPLMGRRVHLLWVDDPSIIPTPGGSNEASGA